MIADDSTDLPKLGGALILNTEVVLGSKNSKNSVVWKNQSQVVYNVSGLRNRFRR
jgi:hypothetical protein